MSEQSQQPRGPLESDRGVTTIADGVVSQIASMAANEVEGVHMGGSVSRTAGGLLGSVTGSSGGGRGVSVEVGRTEVAIDLTMGIDYGRNILQTVEEARRRITDRVESMTGLKVTECNAFITDIVFPEGKTGVGTGRAAPESTAGDETRELSRPEGAGGDEETAELNAGKARAVRREP